MTIIPKVLKNNSFIKLWGAQILSQVSAYFLNFVLMVKIYEITHSTTALSLFLLFYTAPSVFLGLFAGAFIDLWSKRKVLYYSNLSQAIIVLLYLTVGNQIWPIFIIVLLYSICDEFFAPAEAASIPSIVKKENLPMANNLFFLTGQGALLAGSLIAGPVIKHIHPNAPYFLVFLFLLLGAYFAFKLPEDKPTNKRKLTFTNLKEEWRSLTHDIREGYEFIRQQPRVYFPFIFYVITQIIIVVSIILFPSLSSELLKIDIKDAGAGIFAPVIIGAIAGGYFISRKLKDYGRKKFISLGWMIGGVCFLLLSLVVPLIMFGRYLIPIILFFLGLGTIFIINTSLTMIQENTPTQIRGRVFGSLSAFMIIASYLPTFFLAAITDLFGIRITLFLIGLAILTVGIISSKVDRNYVLKNNNRS